MTWALVSPALAVVECIWALWRVYIYKTYYVLNTALKSSKPRVIRKELDNRHCTQGHWLLVPSKRFTFKPVRNGEVEEEEEKKPAGGERLLTSGTTLRTDGVITLDKEFQMIISPLFLSSNVISFSFVDRNTHTSKRKNNSVGAALLTVDSRFPPVRHCSWLHLSNWTPPKLTR